MADERRQWRVGSKYRVHVYEVTPDGDIPVATAMTEEYAEQIVRDHNFAIAYERDKK